ncbi:MAG: hypothetical protein E6Q67_03000 [Roseateles sp.]|nr:MAG: hypothetical protein E6Q67_03000 [Roseateles sp.]
MRFTLKQAIAFIVLVSSGPMLGVARSAREPDAGQMLAIMYTALTILILFMPTVNRVSWFHELSRAEKGHLRGRDFSAFRNSAASSGLRSRLLRYPRMIVTIAVCTLLAITLDAIAWRDAQAVLWAACFYFLGSAVGCLAIVLMIPRAPVAH